MTSGTVLFAWELGEGLGHASRLTAISDALLSAESGIRPVFAFSDPIFGRAALGGRKHRILTAPAPPVVQDIRSLGASYADILAVFGYGDATQLRLSLEAWDDLIALVEPDLIVADHSPTACLAARGRIPVLITGNGFSVPPADLATYPALQAEGQAALNQTHILRVMNEVLVSRSAPTLEALPEFLRCEGRAVFTLPQLDPYHQFRTDRLLGPYAVVTGPMDPPATSAVFLYSRADQENLDEIAQALWDCGLPLSCYLRGGRSVGATFLKSMGTEVFDEPRPLQEVFASSSVIVSHGGGGLVQAALAAGRPQVTIPNHLEATISGRRIESLGAGLCVEDFRSDRLRDAVALVSSDARYVAGAQAQARTIETMQLPDDPLALVANMCKMLLRGQSLA